jgi:hypothetical protein
VTELTLLAASRGGGTETLSGKFDYLEVEPAGVDSLFTPGDPNAPDAGQQSFASSLLAFLNLVNGDGSAGANSTESYNTSTSFSDTGGGGEGLSYCGSFQLTNSATSSSAASSA